MSAKRPLDEPESANRPVKRKSIFPIAELYKPAMVTIVVSNAATVADGEEPDEEEFLLPRALVSMQSKYFNNVFKGRFAERKSGRSVLDDVSPWVFRCFVGWVFFQRIFYDDARVEPSELGDAEIEEYAQVTEGGPQPKPTDMSLPNIAEVDKSLGNSTIIAGFLDTTFTGVENTHPTTPLQANPDTIDITSEAHRDEDPNDAVTWRWSELFELYVFSERYDSRAFRMAVFDAIQLKLLQKRPVTYEFPSAADVTYVTQNVPATSKLIRLLAEQHQNLPLSRSFHRQLDALSKMPSAYTEHVMCRLDVRSRH